MFLFILFFSFLLTFFFYHYRNQLLCHSAKPVKHSANARQIKFGELYIGNSFFAECHQVLGKEKSPSRRPVTATEPLSSILDDTWQRVSLFAECPPD
jgi:hypothetical protein